MESNGGFCAGAGMADVTPEMGIQIAGDVGRRRPVESVRDRLYARALVLSDGTTTACLISADVLLITRPWAEELECRVGEYLGIEPEAVIPHTTQTHSAPSVGNEAISPEYPMPPGLEWLRGGDDRYPRPFLDGVMKAVREAKQGMRPATLKAVRGMDGRVAFNRRHIMRDGTVKTHPPLCSPDILCCEGPVDPEVGVAVVEDADGKAMAALLHHTCHPTHGYANRWVSAGWPGHWASGVRRMLGEACVPLVLNGACGNIHHTNHLDPRGTANTIESVGDKLLETTQRLLPGLRKIAATPLRRSQRILRIPIRALTREAIADAKKQLRDHPEPTWSDDAKTNVDWAWVYAHSILDLAERRKQNRIYDYEIQALRVGDLALVAWPGEPFVEAQLEVKRNSPAPYTFVAHCCNDVAGYQPTREAFKRGGFETQTANWSKLEKGSLEKVTAQSRAMLKELFDWRNKG